MNKVKCLFKIRLNIVFGASFLIHIIFFIFLYGVSSLNINYTDWMIDSEDLGLEYFGSLFYARSKWCWPIGLMEGLTYPNYKSVVYFDALPLLSIIGKILKNILPYKFQLWGIYSFAVFGLQGGLGACCIQKFIKKKWLCIVGSFLFSMQMIFLSNIYTQIPLSSHWILLCAFLIALYYEELNRKKRLFSILGICIITMFVQTAFLPMVLCILFFRMVAEIFIKRTWKTALQNLLLMGIGLLSIVLSAWFLGLFYTSTTMAGGGLGNAAVRLDSFIDPMGGSLFFPSRSNYKITSVAYLGLGTIILFCTASVWFFIKHKENKEFNGVNTKVYLICSFIAMLISIFFALSPIAKWGSKIIYEIPLNDMGYKLWSTVRSSYRLVWSVIYGIIIFSLWILKKAENKYLTVIIVLCVFMQIVDISPFIKVQSERYIPNAKYECPLQSDAWLELSHSKNKLIFMNGDSRNNAMSLIQAMERPQIYGFAYYAYENEMEMNDFYYARKDSELMNITRANTWKNLYAGDIDESAIYIFMEMPVRLIHQKSMNFYWVDGYFIGIADELEESQNTIKYQKDIPISILPITNSKTCLYLENGEVNEKGGRTIHSGGRSYGPRISLNAGNYKIAIIGEHLTSADIQCSYENESIALIRNLTISETRIEYEISFDELVHGVDFIIENNSNEDINIKDITIEIDNM